VQAAFVLENDAQVTMKTPTHSRQQAHELSSCGCWTRTDVAISSDYQEIRTNGQADDALCMRRWHAVAVRLEVEQAGRRHPYVAVNITVNGFGIGIRCGRSSCNIPPIVAAGHSGCTISSLLAGASH
jgi:hypothetical protein